MSPNQRSSDKFFTWWLKGISFCVPLIVLLGTAWASALNANLNSIRKDATTATKLLAGYSEKIKSQDREIALLREWLVRMETKLDRVLETHPR